VQVDGCAGFVPFGEVIAFQHTLHGDLAGKAQNIEKRVLAKPLAVVADFGLGGVNDLADLFEVINSVVLNLLLSQPGPSLIAAAGIAHQGGVISDNQYGLMTQLLELPELAQWNSVAQVNVDAGRIDAIFHSQRLAGGDAALQLFDEFIGWGNLVGATFENRQLFFQWTHEPGTIRTK